MLRIRSILVAAILAVSTLAAPAAPKVFAYPWATCDYSDYGTPFMLRQSVVPDGPWIAHATMTISNSNEYPILCLADPNQGDSLGELVFSLDRYRPPVCAMPTRITIL